MRRWHGVFHVPHARRRHRCAFWQVDDIQSTVAWLKGRGVVFDDCDTPGMKTVDSIFSGGGAMAAWFKDTEGNIMAVVQDLAEGGLSS